MAWIAKAWPWRRRWEAVIVGRESGGVTPLPFVRFRTEADGLAWCAEMNGKTRGDLTRFELRRR